jgi:cardiolipin synthase
MIFDTNCAIIGGMNLAKEYMGYDDDINRWRDINFILRGSVVSDLLAVFESDWQFAASRMESKYYKRPEYTNNTRHGDAVLQIVSSGPDTIGDNLYDTLISSIYNARKSIYIVTPYFILDDAFQKAFMIAIRRGIDVNIILPRNSNHPTPDLVRSISVRKLRSEGAKIWLHPKMVHAKIFKFDDDLAIIGSANLDLRSLLLNFEVSCFIYSEPEVQMIDEWIKQLMSETDRTPKPQTLLKTWLEDAAQLLKPLL